MIRTISLRRSLAAAAALVAVLATGASAQQRTGSIRAAVLSPRDTVELAFAPAQRIWVDYGRPSMRGRKIMGGLVPYGRVWRTGANAATTLVTDVDLDLAGTRVPRGTYTLYTIPTARGWTLIVNRQTGQWGTEYSPSRDFARIPMQTRALNAPVEQFTISLERQNANAGNLAFAWEKTRAWVPFRVVRTPPPARR